ncbi:MAG: hypothetical protein HXX08_11570 [Chloroflexi bacterium]|uniref:Uncharacterized protein n=1 Tax=Candidatus Chlorohelix allophototropha TaxID=3003348 RepID=A0A8T7M2A5_9CHLR|nr:hypothetical protein [Chloroflexota bacterium]WJW65878.1 hypothetical protein OZ401_001657 [Chloroflexota bacterium L227-S17]
MTMTKKIETQTPAKAPMSYTETCAIALKQMLEQYEYDVAFAEKQIMKIKAEVNLNVSDMIQWDGEKLIRHDVQRGIAQRMVELISFNGLHIEERIERIIADGEEFLQKVLDQRMWEHNSTSQFSNVVAQARLSARVTYTQNTVLTVARTYLQMIKEAKAA